MPHIGEEMNMAKRKPDPSLAGQLDMFGDVFENVTPATVVLPHGTVSKSVEQPKPANDMVDPSIVANEAFTEHNGAPEVGEVEAAANQIGVITDDIDTRLLGHNDRVSQTWLHDEWWTTAMVCAYLKLGHKAIWERQRDLRFQFPQAFHFGTMRHRWRSEDVKAWAKLSR
jgi:predicted DNA-binding transcriptional regulator AlpA